MSTQQQPETVILIQSPDRHVAEHFAIYLCRVARLSGGTSWAGWGRPTLKIRIQGIPRAQVLAAKRMIEDCALRAKLSLDLTEMETLATPLPDVVWGAIKWGTVLKQRLTKRLLLGLPPGACVVVPPLNKKMDACDPGFFAVMEDENRKDCWRRAVQAKAAYRICRVTWAD